MNKVGFSVSGGAMLAIAAACFFGAGRLLLLVFLAAAIHELGHYVALKLCGGGITSLRLELTGIVMRGVGLKSYARESITAAAGPAASLVLAVLCALYARFFNCEPAYRLAGMSLLFCLFNLLPVFPLDGGRLLYAWSARLFGLMTADKTLCVSSCAVIFIVLSAGAYVLIVTKTNFTLLAAAVWLLVYYCKNINNSIK